MKELVYHRLFYPMLDRYADKVGFHDGDYHGTFGQHGDRVQRLAHALRHQYGVEPGDRFAVMSCNSHQYLELFHAALLSGAVINPLNLRLAGKELQHIMVNSQSKVVFVDAIFAEHFQRNMGDTRSDAGIEQIVLIGDGDLGQDARYDDLLAAGEPVTPPEPEETDPCVLMYTGGTTGVSKGALLEQRAEMLNLYHIAMTVGLNDERVYLHQTPMFHAASMGGVMGISISGGVSTFVPMFEPGAVLDNIETYDVNWTMMVPTMIAMVLQHPAFRPERLASMRDLVYGASPMPAALLARIIETMPDVNIWQGYGMTECSSLLTMLTDRDHRRGGAILRSAGRPVLGTQISIRDESGHEVPTGTDGEVWARGANFMREYWRMPEQTEAVFTDGWYRTGDAGHVDREGYLFLVDRVKDMIVTGGENVYSVEVENALSTHPSVAQVAVIGIPHDTWGEQVHAVVVLAGDVEAGDELEQTLRDHARSAIAGYKLPKSFEFRSEPLPLSGALKPLKRELRAKYWEGRDSAIN